MTGAVAASDPHYKALQSRYAVEEAGRYGALVVPNGNANRPYHRWFHLKEGFSCELLPEVLRECGLGEVGIRLVDPYAGVGTSIISAFEQQKPVEALGFERNPFLQFAAATKARALGGETCDDFHGFVHRVVDASRDIIAGPAPQLSTFSRREYFNEEDLGELLCLRSAINTIEGTSLTKDLARLCLAGSLEPVSSLRRDGRALRRVVDKPHAEPLAEFLRRCAIVAHDLWLRDKSESSGRVRLADGRDPGEHLPCDFLADLVVFSPPYPNNIDYTEVYKLETWFLQFVQTQEDFREQRLETVRSHPSVKFPDEYYAEANGYKEEFDKAVTPIVDSIPSDEDRRWRERLVKGYFDDMLKTLAKANGYLKHDGWLVYIVGNSLHGSGDKKFLIAADLVMARLAEVVGFEVASVKVARRPKRRAEAFPFLRESVVFLRKS